MTFDLGRAPAFAMEDFLVSPSNAEAFDYVDCWPRWSTPALIVVGPPGSGKTHLAMVWARHANARFAELEDLADPDQLAVGHAVVLDDGERFGSMEAGFFHLLNLMREQGGWLLITAQSHPDRWGLKTPDLVSRLRLCPVVTLNRPTLELVQAVLVKLFEDRQIRIDADLVAYAALHLDQSLEAARTFVQTVDEASLAGGLKVTRQLAAATIAAMREEEES